MRQGKSGLDTEDITPSWNKTTVPQKRKLEVQEIRQQEEVGRGAKAVAQARQGQWMNSEGVEKKKISWLELWETEAFRISFTIRAAYYILPSPKNLIQWYGEDPTCLLCLTPATLKHILGGCKTSHTQGRYSWWHNLVLQCLAAVLKDRWTSINALPPTSCLPTTAYVQIGECQSNLNTSTPDALQLSRVCDWKLVADIGQKLCFLVEIVSTNQRPDLVLWLTLLKHAYIIDGAVEEAYKHKKLR